MSEDHEFNQAKAELAALTGKVAPEYLEQITEHLASYERSGRRFALSVAKTMLDQAYDVRSGFASMLSAMEELLRTADKAADHFGDKNLTVLTSQVRDEIETAKSSDLTNLDPRNLAGDRFPSMTEFTRVFSAYRAAMNANDHTYKRAKAIINDDTAFILVDDYNRLPEHVRNDEHVDAFLAARSVLMDAACDLMDACEEDQYAFDQAKASALDTAEATYVAAGNELSASVKANRDHEQHPWTTFEDFRREAMYRLSHRSLGII